MIQEFNQTACHDIYEWVDQFREPIERGNSSGHRIQQHSFKAANVPHTAIARGGEQTDKLTRPPGSNRRPSLIHNSQADKYVAPSPQHR